MSRKSWMRPLKKSMKKIIEKETWAYDPDARHHRIEGQFGSRVRVFGRKRNHLVICIDISDPTGFTPDYDEVVEFIDKYCRGVSNKFKKVHLNFWAESSYLVRPLRFYRQSLLEVLKRHYQDAKNEISTKKALASAIINPFLDGQDWSKLKPDLMFIFTRDIIEDDLDSLQRSKFRKFKNELIWIYTADQENADLSEITSIDPHAEKRTVVVVNESGL